MYRTIATLIAIHCALLAGSEAFGQGATPGLERESTIRGFLSLYEEGKIDEARSIMVQFLQSGKGHPEDAAVLGKTYVNTGELTEAEHWFRVALDMAAENVNKSPENIQLLLAKTLWLLDKKPEALNHFATAGEHPSFEQAAQLDITDSLCEKCAEGRENFIEYAEALESSGRTSAAVPYRKVASAGTLKAGFWAIRMGYADRALSYFYEAESIWPLDKFPIEVQMTVLRDMIVAYWRTARFMHGAVAVERLFSLCHPSSKSEWTCPMDGVASAPLEGGKFSFFVTIHGKQLRPVARLHLALVSKLMEQVFLSVSWEPTTLLLRKPSRAQEFLGSVVSSAYKKQAVRREGTGDCLPETGTPYAQATGWEEDRVEFERCWFLLREKRAFKKVLAKELSNKQYRLIVKGLLIDMEFATKFGSLALSEALSAGTVAGISLSEVGTGLSKSEDASTQTAFAVGTRLMKLLQRVREWPLTE